MTHALWYAFLASWAFTLLAFGAVTPTPIAVTAIALALLNLVATFALPERLKLSKLACYMYK